MSELIASLSFFFIFLTYNYGIVHGANVSLCGQTPHPELCNSLNIPKEENMFVARNMVLSETLVQAQNVRQRILAMNMSSFNEKGKLALVDCVELYEDTLYQLNKSINSSSMKIIDAQTWLSAAMANHQTCLNGFHDFQLSSYLEKSPFVLSDFSKYLSISLAINKDLALPSSSFSTNHQLKGRRHLLAKATWSERGSITSPMDYNKHTEFLAPPQLGVFPEWLSIADRKLLQVSPASTKANIVVAQDGSGNFKTISEALVAAKSKRKGTRRFVIYVKRGIYRENVEIKKTMKSLMFIGDGIDATIITGNKNVQDGYTTFRSATFGVSGEGFIAKGITFENSAGPQKHQAVALRSSSDFSVFHGCSFKGYQDTLYVHSHRQFYRDCDIYGTVDFIFGDAVVVFQNCNIYIGKPMSNQVNTVTAQSRISPYENTGIIIHSCTVTAASDLRLVQGSFKSYLGRPWKQYSRTLFIKSTIDSVIDSAGWLPWNGNFALNTLYYGEYMNLGIGARTGGRVKWPGYHVITSVTEAGKFSVGNFLAGDSWLPATGVPFSSSL